MNRSHPLNLVVLFLPTPPTVQYHAQALAAEDEIKKRAIEAKGGKMAHEVCQTMNYIESMVRKGNLVVFESTNISETREVTPTKNGVHAIHINPYLHEFFEPIPFD